MGGLQVSRTMNPPSLKTVLYLYSYSAFPTKGWSLCWSLHAVYGRTRRDRSRLGNWRRNWSPILDCPQPVEHLVGREGLHSPPVGYRLVQYREQANRLSYYQGLSNSWLHQRSSLIWKKNGNFFSLKEGFSLVNWHISLLFLLVTCSCFSYISINKMQPHLQVLHATTTMVS